MGQNKQETINFNTMYSIRYGTRKGKKEEEKGNNNEGKRQERGNKKQDSREKGESRKEERK